MPTLSCNLNGKLKYHKRNLHSSPVCPAHRQTMLHATFLAIDCIYALCTMCRWFGLKMRNGLVTRRGNGHVQFDVRMILLCLSWFDLTSCVQSDSIEG